jgi:dienelactone hydrolase
MARERLANLTGLSTLFVLWLSMAGCIHLPAEPGYGGPKPLSEETRADYAYRRYQGSYTEKILEQNRHYTLKRISFPSNHIILPQQHDITIDYYAIDAAEKVPVILVLPILGGSNNIASSFARYFTRHGFAAAVVHRQKIYPKQEFLKEIDKLLCQIVFDHKQAIDWVESRPELDASRIGVFGVSMGGIKGALISALDPRIGASVLVLAAGDLPYILARSNDKGIIKRRNALLAEKTLTPEQLQQELTEKIRCDPINYAEHIDADKTLMILARFDAVVPYHKGLELKEKIGNPETILLWSGHYSAIVYIYYVKYQSRKFLQQHLQ